MSVISVKNLRKEYNLFTGDFQKFLYLMFPKLIKVNKKIALDDISFEVKKGDVLGIVGNNGSGKSTLLKLITGLGRPTKGDIEIEGKVVSLLELGSGFNKEFTGMQNIRFSCELFGLNKKEIDDLIPTIIEFAEIDEDYLYQPIKKFSSGMKSRLAFSVSIFVKPDILILDEVLSVGDVRFQKKCIDRMNEFKSNGVTILFVSHSLGTVNNFCGSAIWLNKGKIQSAGKTSDVIALYRKG